MALQKKYDKVCCEKTKLISAIKSYLHFEHCPNVIQQALTCGTPIVATDCPSGTSKIVEGDKWGRLVPVRNPKAMAEAIIFTLQDVSHPDGRLRRANFDPKRNAEKYPNLVLPDFIPHLTETVVL